MVILVPRWLDFSWQVRLQMCLKFCMVKVANRTRAQTHSTISSKLYCACLGSGTICDFHHTIFLGTFATRLAS